MNYHIFNNSWIRNYLQCVLYINNGVIFFIRIYPCSLCWWPMQKIFINFIVWRLKEEMAYFKASTLVNCDQDIIHKICWMLIKLRNHQIIKEWQIQGFWIKIFCPGNKWQFECFSVNKQKSLSSRENQEKERTSNHQRI